MKQKIQGFHLDGEGHRVADLACGHQQHVHHEPPCELECKRCDEVRAVIAEATRAACLEAMTRAYEEGGFSGLCAEGRWELAVDAVKSLDLTAVLAALSKSAR